MLLASIFLLFQRCFQRSFLLGSFKVGTLSYSVKGLKLLTRVFSFIRNPNKPLSLGAYIPVTWPAYSISSPSYLTISESMSATSVQSRFHSEKMAFWLQYIPKIIKSNSEPKMPDLTLPVDLIG